MISRRVTDDLRVAGFVQALHRSVKAVYSRPRRPCSDAGNGKRTQGVQRLVRLMVEGGDGAVCLWGGVGVGCRWEHQQ